MGSLRRVVSLASWGFLLAFPLRGTPPGTAEGVGPVSACGDQEAPQEVRGRKLTILRDEEVVTVKQGDRVLMRYRYRGSSHKPYVEELSSPGGVNVLRDAPPRSPPPPRGHAGLERERR